MKNNHLTIAPIIQRLPSAVQRTLGFLTITTAQKAAILLKRTKPRRRIALRRGSFMLKNGKSLDFKRFSGIEKAHRNSIKITVDLWRRWRDSNSRRAFDPYTISNRARSTNYATSPCLLKKTNYQLVSLHIIIHMCRKVKEYFSILRERLF